MTKKSTKKAPKKAATKKNDEGEVTAFGKRLLAEAEAEKEKTAKETPIGVPCPKCDAQIGVSCRGEKGKPIATFHPERAFIVRENKHRESARANGTTPRFEKAVAIAEAERDFVYKPFDNRTAVILSRTVAGEPMRGMLIAHVGGNNDPMVAIMKQLEDGTFTGEIASPVAVLQPEILRAVHRDAKPGKLKTEIQKLKAGEQVDGFKWLEERRAQDAKDATKPAKAAKPDPVAELAKLGEQARTSGNAIGPGQVGATPRNTIGSFQPPASATPAPIVPKLIKCKIIDCKTTTDEVVQHGAIQTPPGWFACNVNGQDIIYCPPHASTGKRIDEEARRPPTETIRQREVREARERSKAPPIPTEQSVRDARAADDKRRADDAFGKAREHNATNPHLVTAPPSPAVEDTEETPPWE